MTNDVEAGVLQDVADTLMKPVAGLKTSDRFDKIGFDSLDVIECVMGVEERFGLEIKDEDLKDVDTIGDLIGLVKRLQG